MITGSPIIVALLGALCGALVWLFMRNQLANKDSIIERQCRDFHSAIQAKDATIEMQQHRIASLSATRLERTDRPAVVWQAEQDDTKRSVRESQDRLVISRPDGLERRRRRIEAAYEDFVTACNKTVSTWERWDYVAHRSPIQEIRDKDLARFGGPKEPSDQELRDLKQQLLVDIAALRTEMVALAVFLDMPIE